MLEPVSSPLIACSLNKIFIYQKFTPRLMCYMRSSNLTFAGGMLFRDAVEEGTGGEAITQRVCEEGRTHGIRAGSPAPALAVPGSTWLSVGLLGEVLWLCELTSGCWKAWSRMGA